MGFIDLFRPRWRHSDCLKRKEAINKISNQSILHEIAITDEDYTIRKIAVSRLTDQIVLAMIAERTNDYYIGEIALSKIKDQFTLADIAKNGRNSHVRETAVSKLNDQVLLMEIAKNDSNWRVRAEAYRSLGNTQAALIEIAINEESDYECKEAVEQITDQNALVEIFENAVKPAVRLCALDRITDHNVLLDVAKNNESSYVRESAVIKLTDEIALANIAKTDEAQNVRRKAASKLVTILRNMTDNKDSFGLIQTILHGDKTVVCDHDDWVWCIKHLTDLGDETVVDMILHRLPETSDYSTYRNEALCLLDEYLNRWPNNLSKHILKKMTTIEDMSVITHISNPDLWHVGDKDEYEILSLEHIRKFAQLKLQEISH